MLDRRKKKMRCCSECVERSFIRTYLERNGGGGEWQTATSGEAQSLCLLTSTSVVSIRTHRYAQTEDSGGVMRPVYAFVRLRRTLSCVVVRSCVRTTWTRCA